MLPGFQIELRVQVDGFLTSLVFDDDGVLHFTTTDGKIWRREAGVNKVVASVDSAVEGNAALLGMAFDGEGEIVVHYVASDLRSDVISKVNPSTAEERIIADLVCSTGPPCPTEHHGGNPIVSPEGAIFVGIGDHGVQSTAQNLEKPGGKIYRIDPDGGYQVEAIGFRNPYDLFWDARFERLIVGDNGAIGQDEITFVRAGENHGWPLTMGNAPAVDGMVPPVYTFSETVAPTGLAAVDGPGYFRDGILVGGFVTRAIYYFPWWSEDAI
ncbi:MAG: PQQ-dependent sugar dehydrogenase, partial [Acidobacteria bacterium]|nr:PQQ-dependent sugar dehydrogenase [Acidobacteriota bacterium]